MDEKQLTKISNSIKKKIGEENFAKISDDMGTLITGNAANLETRFPEILRYDSKNWIKYIYNES